MEGKLRLKATPSKPTEFFRSRSLLLSPRWRIGRWAANKQWQTPSNTKYCQKVEKPWLNRKPCTTKSTNKWPNSIKQCKNYTSSNASPKTSKNTEKWSNLKNTTDRPPPSQFIPFPKNRRPLKTQFYSVIFIPAPPEISRSQDFLTWKKHIQLKQRLSPLTVLNSLCESQLGGGGPHLTKFTKTTPAGHWRGSTANS